MRALADKGVEVFPGAAGNAGLDLEAALKLLARRGITRLMVEAGPRLAAAFLNADLVDEAVLLRSPKALGADAIDALDGLQLAALTSSPRLRLVDAVQAGADRIEAYLRRQQ
jgi:diaminohydroxyphosphoribosylaminopyrimidine deaminase / 5-amino-6-(5-phosphoribosylamino)uracil reductase